MCCTIIASYTVASNVARNNYLKVLTTFLLNQVSAGLAWCFPSKNMSVCTCVCVCPWSLGYLKLLQFTKLLHQPTRMGVTVHVEWVFAMFYFRKVILNLTTWWILQESHIKCSYSVAQFFAAENFGRLLLKIFCKETWQIGWFVQ